MLRAVDLAEPTAFDERERAQDPDRVPMDRRPLLLDDDVAGERELVPLREFVRFGDQLADGRHARRSAEQKRVVRDAVGNELHDGDAVTVIKDLKVKGSSLVVKMGTKVKNIRLVDGDHDIDCRIEGIGAMGLKSEFVKKA